MRIADAPARQDDLADVGLVVAVRVLEEDEGRGLADDDAALGEDDTRGDVEVVGEDRKLIGLAVAIRVLADLDAVMPALIVDETMRVVGRLDHP